MTIITDNFKERYRSDNKSAYRITRKQRDSNQTNIKNILEDSRQVFPSENKFDENINKILMNDNENFNRKIKITNLLV